MTKIQSDRKLNILWSEFIIWDESLSKTTELEILNGLQKLKHNVEILALRSRIKPVENTKIRLTFIPLRNIRLLTPIMFTFAQSLLLCLRIVSSKIDVIITEPGINVLGFFPVIVIGRAKKTKFVLDIRSPPVESSSHLLWSLEKLSCDISILIAKRFFDGITIITPQMRDEFCQRYNLNKATVGVWPSGVSPSIFSQNASSSEKDSLKRNLGLNGKFVVFYHGFFAEDRGLKESVEAMALLRHGYPDLVLFFLGSGPFEQELKTIIANQGLSESVKMHESVKYSDVPKFIAISDVGLVPLPNLQKWRSQCPLKLLEYLAMEKPVIVTNLRAHKEILQDSKSGIFVQSCNAQDIASCIKFAYENKESLPKWGKSGKQLVTEKYTWDQVAETFQNYLFSLKNKRAS